MKNIWHRIYSLMQSQLEDQKDAIWRLNDDSRISFSHLNFASECTSGYNKAAIGSCINELA